MGHIVNNGQQSVVLHASVMPFLLDPGIPGVRSMGPVLSQ